MRFARSLLYARSIWLTPLLCCSGQAKDLNGDVSALTCFLLNEALTIGHNACFALNHIQEDDGTDEVSSRCSA